MNSSQGKQLPCVHFQKIVTLSIIFLIQILMCQHWMFPRMWFHWWRNPQSTSAVHLLPYLQPATNGSRLQATYCRIHLFFHSLLLTAVTRGCIFVRLPMILDQQHRRASRWMSNVSWFAQSIKCYPCSRYRLMAAASVSSRTDEGWASFQQSITAIRLLLAKLFQHITSLF